MSEKGFLAQSGWIVGAAGIAIVGAIGYFAFSSAPPQLPSQQEAQSEAGDKSAAAPSDPQNSQQEDVAAQSSDTPVAADADADGDRVTRAEEARSDEAQTDGAQTDEAQTDPAQPPVDLPRFSDVRLEAGGLAIIAGTAPAGYDVRVEEDGADLASALSNASGDFAMLFDLEPRDGARVLSLVAVSPDGVEYRSDESAILTPPQPEMADERLAQASDNADAAAQTAAEAAPDGRTETASNEPIQPATDDTGTRQAETSELSEAPSAPVAMSGAEGKLAASGEVSKADAETPRPPVEQAAGVESAGGIPEPDDAERELAAAEQTTSQDDPSAPVSDNSTGAGEAETSNLPATAAVARASAQPTVLLAGSDGVELLQPAGSAERLRDRVVIDVISYSDDGNVSLAGRAGASTETGQRVRIYIDNKSIETAEVATDGRWRLNLPSVTPGIYTLRVDQVTASGKVLARFETPFKQESPAALAQLAPSGLAPEGVSASVITVQPGYTLWGIASDRYGSGFDYVQIFEANRGQIRDPDLIYPGQIFELPDGAEPEQE